MKRFLQFLTAVTLIAPFALMTACGGNTPAENPAASSADTVIAVNLANYVFDLSVPKELVGTDMISIINNEQMGNLEVSIGKKFGILISEGHARIPNAVEQLEQETMFKNTIMEKDSALVMYQRHLPDQQKYHVHFVQNVLVNDQKFCVRTRQDGLFNEQEANVMLAVARSLRPHS